jgi:hypothetical protein
MMAGHATELTSPSRGDRNPQSEAAAHFGRRVGSSALLPPPENGFAMLAVFDLPSRGRLQRATARLVGAA